MNPPFKPGDIVEWIDPSFCNYAFTKGKHYKVIVCKDDRISFETNDDSPTIYKPHEGHGRFNTGSENKSLTDVFRKVNINWKERINGGNK